MENLVTISTEEYKELVRKAEQRDIMLVIMRRHYRAESNSEYMDCIDFTESFDEDFAEFK